VPDEGGRVYKTMRWGLVPIWSKDLKIGSSLINARLETASTKPAFRSAWKERRCLIPASGYYEWDEVPVAGQSKPRKQPFYITRKDGLPFTFAGLWERWRDGMLSFTLLTTVGTAVTRHLHDRMPVILDPSGFACWLEHGNVEPLADLEAAVHLFPVSRQVNSSKYDAENCIAPLTGPA
jgi:putative SOS response-associated peptidase YedK